MTFDGRLDLMHALTARERGLLVLRSLKEGTDKDPGSPGDDAGGPDRRVQPPHRPHERRQHSPRPIIFIEEEAEMVELRLGWLATLRFWELHMAELQFAASILVREPITESEHGRLVEKAATEYLTSSEAASRLVDLRRPWSDEDLEEATWLGELVVKDEAWKRLCAEGAEELRRAVAAGEIESKGKGKALRLRSGSFDAWLGMPVTVYPEWAADYDVRPDADAALVEMDRRTLRHLREALEKMPLQRALEGREEEADDLTRLLEDKVRGLMALRWKDLRVAEKAVEEIAGEFGGEDPLRPVLREVLERSRAGLLKAKEYFERLSGDPAVRSEADEEDLEQVRQFVWGGRRLFS